MDNLGYVIISFREDYNPKKGDINLFIDGEIKKCDNTFDVAMKCKGDTLSEKISYIKTILIDNKDIVNPIAHYSVYGKTKIKENFYRLTESEDLIEISDSEYQSLKSDKRG
jgi:hypothetical protein